MPFREFSSLFEVRAVRRPDAEKRHSRSKNGRLQARSSPKNAALELSLPSTEPHYSSVGGKHGVHQAAKRGTKEHQEGREGCQEEKDDLEAAEEDAHGTWQTGSQGGKTEAAALELRESVSA